MNNLTQYKLFIGNDKKYAFEVTFSFENICTWEKFGRIVN